ncbi:hypothetical protein KSP39_PZI021635 [Platanthera zijinensis]|uniref:Reverse transcriptase zinc-binding domain-containing protein n=1 Tax=Platanthera zijinensis TaxID=2320716 RepID=A0AAP0FVV4_9ASPA
MGNVAARVIRADGSLFARAFACKYAGKDRFKPNRSHSKIWKCICTGSRILGKQSFWMVGDGSKISTLEDAWLGELPLCKWPTFINIFWKIKASPRSLMLIWRAMNNLLPTNDWLYDHRLRTDPNCPWGCNQPEDIYHLLGNCRFISRIRATLSRMNFNFHSSKKLST